MKTIMVGCLIVLLASVAQADDCQQAEILTTQAYQAGQRGASAAEQQTLLEQALRLCPTHPEAHNNLGVLLENVGRYDLALTHYQQAARLKPDFPEAWFGVGEVYTKTGQLALALEAYLNACHDPDARTRIEDLLSSQRYRSATEGEMLDQQSLQLFFDPARRDAVNAQLRACGFTEITRAGVTYRAYVEPVVIFSNILFDRGQASLKAASFPQLQEIGAALAQFPNIAIRISGHTDTQPFRGRTAAESVPLNLQLSQDRAATVAEYLVGMGIPRGRMHTEGYGQMQPLATGDTEDAYRQNRRVEIEVE